MALSIIERMRARTKVVAATTTIEVAQPIKAIGEERVDDGATWKAWIKYIHAIDRFPQQRQEFAEQFTRETGRVLA